MKPTALPAKAAAAHVWLPWPPLRAPAYAASGSLSSATTWACCQGCCAARHRRRAAPPAALSHWQSPAAAAGAQSGHLPGQHTSVQAGLGNPRLRRTLLSCATQAEPPTTSRQQCKLRPLFSCTAAPHPPRCIDCVLHLPLNEHLCLPVKAQVVADLRQRRRGGTKLGRLQLHEWCGGRACTGPLVCTEASRSSTLCILAYPFTTRKLQPMPCCHRRHTRGGQRGHASTIAAALPTSATYSWQAARGAPRSHTASS